MDEQSLGLKNSIMTKNLYKTEFQEMVQDVQSFKRIISLKLKSQYGRIVEKVKVKDEGKKQRIKEQQQKKIQLTNTDCITTILNDLTKPKQNQKEKKIESFQTYDNNVGSEAKDYKDLIQTSNNTVVLKNKMQMNLAESTKLGTIRASTLHRLIKPTWHAPYKLYRVIVGHQGWVRCLAVSPCNTFFASGSADRTIKFWDLASGELKISLTGHINTIRGLQFSKNHPYLFSCGEDKSVKCWDLEMNKVIRNYHGHLSGVYCLKIHDGLSILVSGSRDSTAKVWDLRVRKQIHSLIGHAHTVGSILTQEHIPHIVTGSYDSFVKMWDVGSGKCIKTLTNHKKSIRAMTVNPYEYTFATGSSDNIKVWKCPQGQFLRNISGHHSIINDIVINQDNVLVSAGDDGTLKFWDWSSGYNFQTEISQPQPGSIAAQSGIFALKFDRSGTRLISGQCDKTIKMWKQDQNANQVTHPIKSFKMEFQLQK